MTNKESVGESSVRAAKKELRWLKSAKRSAWAPPTNVGTTERLVSAGVGAAALLLGLRKGRGPVGLTLSALGAALLARGATGYCPAYHAAGKSPHRPDEYRKLEAGEHAPPPREGDPVEEASRDSFPASDPPGWTGAKA